MTGSQDSRHPPAVQREQRVADGVDAPVDTVKRPAAARIRTALAVKPSRCI